jgi:hypothetical protein
MNRHEVSKEEINELFHDVFNLLRKSEWPQIHSHQQEKSITRNLVAPVIRNYLVNRGAHQFVLRSDGYLTPRPLVRHGMSFTPDVDISRLNQRLLAIEVKMLRNSDASGSLTKALGQTFSYRALGYERTIGLIFESRDRKARNLDEFIQEMNSVDRDVQFIYAA